ncbi:ligand-binding sensor domain-containing protein [Flavihumibacter petaseus]|uniref:ligand-binding sensor domain-containing protein n=1 Tax=Flavihumibacter petaseus TaxID=549295 RepID=UPI00069C32F1|nr:sensor histidine kinase [Flavihumibacter petaseus]
MRGYFRLLLAITCCLTVANGFAQPYYFRHYQTENGLTNNTVFCSTQSNNGFIWFGTKEGLNRFDGYRFKKIRHATIAPENAHAEFVLSIFNDAKTGNLWVGSSLGLFLYDEKEEILKPVVDSLRDVNAIQVDQQGRIWFVSIFSLHCYNPRQKTCIGFEGEQFPPTTSLSLMPSGDLLASSIFGEVYRFTPGTSTHRAYNMFNRSAPSVSVWVHRVTAVNDTLALVGTSNQGLKRLNLRTGNYDDVFSRNADMTTIYVRDIMRNAADEYWFATESGIFILNTTTNQLTNLKKKFLDPYSLSDNAVYTLCKDREGGIWAGTFFGGVNYHPKPFTFFEKYFPDNSAASISGSAVREICEDKNHAIWIGTEDFGLNKLDPATGRITKYSPNGEPGSISYSNIHGLMPDGNDLWIGTFEHGIDRMDIRTGKVFRHYAAGTGPNTLKSNFGLSFLKSSSNNIYVATSNGVFWYVPAIDNFSRPPGAPEYGFMATLLEDHQGIIWIGSHNDGLYAYDPVNRITTVYKHAKDNPNTLSSNIINALYEDGKHQLWIATDGGGLCKLDASRKQFTSYTTSNGMPSNYTFKILEDKTGQFWISTSRGLVNMNPDNNTMRVYTKENGLLNDQFNYSSGYLQSDGNMYFGSIKGMIRFNPSGFFRNTYQPNLFITGLQVQNKEVAISRDSSYLKASILYTDKITLPYNRSSFSLDFAALSFTSPELTEYSYKMDGLDQDWTYLKANRKAYFTNLAPGNYSFRLKAAVSGQWVKNERVLKVEVLPPWWDTIWARMLYVAIAVSIIYYIIQSYHRRTQIRKEKEIYEAKIDFFTNVAHEIKTPLTLIKGPIDNLKDYLDIYPDIREDLLMMDRNTNRLVTLVTQILDFRKTESKGFRLEFARENISTILEDAFLNFQALAKKRELEYKLELPPNDVFALADEEALNKIFSNLLSNATKYAAEKVKVRLLPPGELDFVLQIEILNDGHLIPEDMAERIFEPFFRLRENSRQKGTGIGLSLARSLAELHGGRLFLLHDLTEPMNCFVLQLPLHQNAADKPSIARNTSYQTN